MDNNTNAEKLYNKENVHSFFSQLQSPEKSKSTFSGRLIFQRIADRQRLIKKNFSNTEGFIRYIQSHPLAALLEQKIIGEVMLHEGIIKQVLSGEDIGQVSVLEKYRLLVTGNYIDPSRVLPDFPSLTGLSNIKLTADLYSKQNDDRDPEAKNLISTEFQNSLKYLENRWWILTQQQLTGPPFPPMSRLTQLIAPVPYSAVWTEELFEREARSMGHLRTAAASRQPNNSETPETPTGGNSLVEASDAVISDASPETASTADEGSSCDCGIESILEKAGANPLKQRILDTELNYTFPGNLGWGEDIFYDYAVMVPVQELDIDGQPKSNEMQSLESPKLSAQFASEILAFLRDSRLSSAIGAQMLNSFQMDLDSVINLNTTRIAELRMLRKRLKEKASICRSISKNRILFGRQSAADWNTLFSSLDRALNEFPQIRSIDRILPNGVPQVDRGTTLQLIDNRTPTLPAEDSMEVNRRSEPGEFSAPNAVTGAGLLASIGAWDWHFADHVPTGWLKRYISYLGGTFTTKLVALRDSAHAVRTQLDLLRAGPSDALADFARFAEGVVNDALLALAQLFDDISEQIPIPPFIKAEGTARLALMLVYRQFWFPEGYVAGKLVGYKNLLPNQKETLKRRTFIKTTREVTNVQEFAASREEDFSRSSKETAELLKEASSDFSFSAKTSGGFDFFIVSGDLETTTTFTQKETSKAMHNRVAEATMKSSVKYNEKREVKVREMAEIENLQEVTTEMENLNREITANYFYYQLHRQYIVTTELASIKPVLLRTRDIPNPATIDEKFLANYAHVLLHALPRQLSIDLQETVGDFEQLDRAVVRRRSDLDQKSAMFEQFQDPARPIPTTPEEQSRWRAQLETLERTTAEARNAYIGAEENFLRAKSRLGRVVTHVRENIIYYMQFIWQSSPKIDQDNLLKEEAFNGQPLGQVTRGFMRIGHYGSEEIFEYAGNSLDCLNSMISNLTPGHQILSQFTNRQLRNLPLFQRLKRLYPTDTNQMIYDKIQSHIFITDPAGTNELDNTRRVQVAQDALVVEALPGQVPLLEGFQMAHRMLDVEKSCLENSHLRERIKDRPWLTGDDDNYNVIRREGDATSLSVQLNRDDSTPSTP